MCTPSLECIIHFEYIIYARPVVSFQIQYGDCVIMVYYRCMKQVLGMVRGQKLGARWLVSTRISKNFHSLIKRVWGQALYELTPTFFLKKTMLKFFDQRTLNRPSDLLFSSWISWIHEVVRMVGQKCYEQRVTKEASEQRAILDFQCV